jgi:hypothetical protein
MAAKNYTYDPTKIAEAGKDRMRFELGDTAIDGREETAALADEEITAVITLYTGHWKRAKLKLVESVCRRFAYEVDTDVGGLKLGLQGRANAWKTMYDELKKEAASCSLPSANITAINGDHYFSAGMHDNPDVYHRIGGMGKCI